MNEPALDKFVENIVVSRRLLKSIKEKLDNHMNVNPNSVNWSHVGDSQHVLESLREIDRFLRDES